MKRKMNFLGKLFIFILSLLIICLIYKFIIINNKSHANKIIITDYNSLNNNEISNESKKNIDKSLDFIVNTSETDRDVVNEIFAEGMNINDFKKVYNQKENYIKSSSKYTNISYDFENKLHYSELEEYYKKLNNSEIVSLELIGQSVDKRNIYGIEVGKGSETIFIDANIHAAEIANTLIFLKYLVDIVNEYENGNKKVINALNKYKIVGIPCINPDGYEIYNFGVESLNNKNLWWYQNKNEYDFSNMKSNANGIDINRNFPTQNAGLYYKNKSLLKSVSLDKTTKTTSYFGGYSLGSEPETQATMYFMLKHYKNTIKYINMHSQGRVIYAGKPNLSNEFNRITIDFANKINKINGYIVFGLSSEEVGEGNDGSSTDFMAELAHDFKFSKKTLRLSTDKYINSSSKLRHSYSVITLETINTYTTQTSVFKNEYYDKKLKNMLFSLLEL